MITVYELVKKPTPDLGELRNTIAREFFPNHIRRYSKSRRKAPIYWQLATPTGELLGMAIYPSTHTATFYSESITTMLLRSLLTKSVNLPSLRVDGGTEALASAQRKLIGAQEAFVEEIRVFRDRYKACSAIVVGRSRRWCRHQFCTAVASSYPSTSLGRRN